MSKMKKYFKEYDLIKMMNYIYFYKFEGITCKPTPHEIEQLIS